MGNVPGVVTTTYVSVTEVEASTEGSHYTRLSSDGSDGGDIVVDPNLLQMDDRRASSESSEDELNSSDEDR